ncbi:outer membrane protein assembly factor BamA precursor [mine drainage metagenome]|uniref:Outer membrane protein assembly factor BamA n=1 Tax=mine drainage metagenome TaxID=410659 RepID=A0A1J5QQ22_9ZZZZ
MKLRTLLFSLIGLHAFSALAMEPFVVKDIRVEGVQRTEAGTVFNYLPVKVGESMDDDKAVQAIKALYATGFFKDVRLESEGDVLVVTVQERPSIAQIVFEGNKAFPSDKMKEGFKQIGLSEGMIFDRAMLDKAEQEIKRQYLSQGKYGATVKAVVTPLERNRVALRFVIDEGAASRIRAINIVGNRSFGESELLKQFSLTTPNWLSWWNKDDQYSKQKLAADIEALRSFYMNRGYLEFNVDSTQVSITTDKRDIYITVNITEGEKYTVSDIKLAGEMLVPENELSALVTVQPGEVFSREKLTKSSKAIGDRLGKDGYAFANVNAVPEVDKDKHTVGFTFFVDPGRRVYVRRINLTGNSRTRDEVLRREMRQLESAWYASDKIDLSKERLNRLGFFSDVNVETPAVPGTADQVDVNFDVTEISTGSIMFGAGLSSAEGVVLGVTVSQPNFLGTGNMVNAAVNTGQINKTISLSYTNPYYTPDGISRGFDVYRRDMNAGYLNIGNYSTSSYGLGMHFAVPLNERDTISFGATADYTSIDLSATPTPPQEYVRYCGNSIGCNDTMIRGDLGWTHDTRDNIMFPNKGTLQRVTLEAGLPGLDLQYYKINLQDVWYKDITKSMTLMLSGQFGIAGSYGGGVFPFFKNFYAGGVDSVRGYDVSSLGPSAMDTYSVFGSPGTPYPYYTGGTRRAIGNVELFFPVPGMTDNKQLRLSTFFDVGSVWGGSNAADLAPWSCNSAASCMRYSTGLGISWYSPFGPIKLVLAKPLNEQYGDRAQMLQFQMGSQF